MVVADSIAVHFSNTHLFSWVHAAPGCSTYTCSPPSSAAHAPSATGELLSGCSTDLCPSPPPAPHMRFQLLGELLLGRSNVKVMVRFVSEPQYLMQMMMLLKDQSRSIQFEAFHVFKVRWRLCEPRLSLVHFAA